MHRTNFDASLCHGWLKQPDRNGRRPIHEAASYGRVAAAKVLVQYGADINALKQAGWYVRLGILVSSEYPSVTGR